MLTNGISLTIIDVLFEELELHPLSSTTETIEYVVFVDGLIDKGDPLTSPLLSIVTVFELIPSLKITLNGAVPEKTGNEISELSPKHKGLLPVTAISILGISFTITSTICVGIVLVHPLISVTEITWYEFVPIEG